MFAKLLKYDMRRSMRVGLPLLIVAICLIIVGIANNLVNCAVSDILTLDLGGTDTGAGTGTSPEAGSGLYVLGEVVASIIVITVTFLMLISRLIDGIVTVLLPITFTVMFIINLVNFYTSLLTDEGYLSFTLPVKPVTILGSKFLNASIWNLSLGFVAIIGVFATKIPNFLYTLAASIKIFGFNWEGIKAFFDGLSVIIGKDGINPLNLILTFLLVPVLYIVMILAQQTFFFFTIFLGGVLAKKHKLLAGAGFSVAGYYIFGLVEQLIAWGAMILCITPLFLIDTVPPNLVVNMVILILNIVLFLTTGVLLVAIIGFFALTSWLMTKKLNLP
jgi:hypothetical protein